MDTIYSYYNVNFTSTEASSLGLKFKKPRKTPFNEPDNYAATGKVCVRIDRPPKGQAGPCDYTVSYSFCSPVDSFNRSLARKICNSRVVSGNTVTISSEEPLRVRDVSDRAISLIFDNNLSKMSGGDAVRHGIKLPRWFCSAPKSSIVPDYRKRR